MNSISKTAWVLLIFFNSTQAGELRGNLNPGMASSKWPGGKVYGAFSLLLINTGSSNSLSVVPLSGHVVLGSTSKQI